jgi:hypothetical protein
MQSRFAPAASALALGILCAASAHAQDSNYWSTAYGTRARLLGGVVIGSPGDISSVYYNPGALALAPGSEFLLAGSAFQFMRVSVENGSAQSKDLVSSTITTVPSLLAGEIPILERDRLAYSFLSRQDVDIDIEQRVSGVPTRLPNATFSSLDLQYHQDVSESWYGMTWARALSPRLGFGISPNLAVRSQRTQSSLLAMAEDNTRNQAVLQYSRDFDYLHYRLLAKLGLSGARDSLTWGITYTTPGLGIFGGGAIRNSVNATDQTGTVLNVIGASFQEELDAKYHSPMGAGAGASYAIGPTRLHASVEWWAAVDKYTLLEGEDYTIHVPITVSNPTGDSTVAAVVTEELDEVVNYGFGLEHHFSPDFAGFLSYHTDRSGRSPDAEPGASVTTWDLNHVTGGVTFNAWRSNFAVGLSGAFGSHPIHGIGNRPDRIPPQDIDSKALIVTGSLGWKITF